MYLNELRAAEMKRVEEEEKARQAEEARRAEDARKEVERKVQEAQKAHEEAVARETARRREEDRQKLRSIFTKPRGQGATETGEYDPCMDCKKLGRRCGPQKGKPRAKACEACAKAQSACSWAGSTAVKRKKGQVRSAELVESDSESEAEIITKKAKTEQQVEVVVSPLAGSGSKYGKPEEVAEVLKGLVPSAKCEQQRLKLAEKELALNDKRFKLEEGRMELEERKVRMAERQLELEEIRLDLERDKIGLLKEVKDMFRELKDVLSTATKRADGTVSSKETKPALTSFASSSKRQ